LRRTPRRLTMNELQHFVCAQVSLNVYGNGGYVKSKASQGNSDAMFMPEALEPRISNFLAFSTPHAEKPTNEDVYFHDSDYETTHASTIPGNTVKMVSEYAIHGLAKSVSVRMACRAARSERRWSMGRDMDMIQYEMKCGRHIAWDPQIIVRGCFAGHGRNVGLWKRLVLAERWIGLMRRYALSRFRSLTTKAEHD
jgi:hypothetical protein